MCCFSGKVDSVHSTRIFARAAGGGRQFLAYMMAYEAGADLAMILPLPVQLPSEEKAVRFINLEKAPKLFDDFAQAFPQEPGKSRGAVGADSQPAQSKRLDVQQVGSFEASYVPSVADFARLDERFRIAPGIWAKIPGYGDFGFAVFKLKQGKFTVHPMGMSFPPRDPRRLFFPTVHIHDGQVHDRAEFDHTLYLQAGPADDRDPGEHPLWTESAKTAGQVLQIENTAGLVAGDLHLWRRRMTGLLRNRDTYGFNLAP